MDLHDEAFLREIFLAFADEPLEPNDDRWVMLDDGPQSEGRGHDPIARISRRIKWARSATVQLLSGVRGTGKSTGLRRLARGLSASRFVVVHCDLVQELGNAGPVEVEAILDVLTQAVRRCDGDDRMVVVVCDALDRFVVPSDREEGMVISIERAFVDPDRFRALGVHVVFAVPAWLELRVPGLADDYDGLERMRGIEVRRHDGEPNETGLAVLQEIVQRRGDWTRLLGSADDLQHVLLETGGHLGSLFRALRGMALGASVRDQLPLGRQAIEHEIAALRDESLPIAIADAVWLHELHCTRGEGLAVPKGSVDVVRCMGRPLLLRYGAEGGRYGLLELVRGAVARMAERAYEDAEDPWPQTVARRVREVRDGTATTTSVDDAFGSAWQRLADQRGR